MFLVSLELGGKLHLPTMPYMRWGSQISLLAVLAVMFVMPHDPSTRVSEVGSQAYMLNLPRVLPPLRSRISQTPMTSASKAPSAPIHSPLTAQSAVYTAHVSARGAEQLRRAIAVSLHWSLRKTIRATTRMFDTTPDIDVPASSSQLLAATRAASASNGTYYYADCGASMQVPVATTVEQLRRVHGARQHWWGDLDARESRQLYHELLPTDLLDESELPLEERAKLAVAARRAARLYTRERCILPVAASCQLLDGMRQLIKQGSWQPDGMSEEQIWDKYAQSHDSDDFDALCYTVLRKSCTSNPHVDALVDVASAQSSAAWTLLDSLPSVPS